MHQQLQQFAENVLFLVNHKFQIHIQKPKPHLNVFIFHNHILSSHTIF